MKNQATEQMRVSTIESFFDLVFVFTITQLTYLVAGARGPLDFLLVLLVLMLIWWMYDAYLEKLSLTSALVLVHLPMRSTFGRLPPSSCHFSWSLPSGGAILIATTNGPGTRWFRLRHRHAHAWRCWDIGTRIWP